MLSITTLSVLYIAGTSPTLLYGTFKVCSSGSKIFYNYLMCKTKGDQTGKHGSNCTA